MSRYRQTLTRQRIHGEDSDFSAWLRRQTNLCSSLGFVVNDIDLKLLNYLTCIDGQGSREIQALMELEVKTRGADVARSQKEHAFLCHSTIRSVGRPVKVKGINVVNYGVSFLKLSNRTPDDSDRMQWGRFNPLGDIDWRIISLGDLFKLLRFEIHPDTFGAKQFRRHHKTSVVVANEETPLGFLAPVCFVKRS